MKNPVFRGLFFILILVLVVVLPWWLSAVLLFGLTLYLPFYLEVVFFGFLLDTLYSIDFSFPFIYLSIATMFLFVTVLLKTQIRR